MSVALAFSEMLEGGRLLRDMDALYRVREEARVWRAAAMAALDSDPRRVYFIQCGGPRGPIKIGLSRDVAQRLRDLQACNPYTLRAICIIGWGGEPLEQALHRRFDAFRLHGEWFACSDEILDFVDLVVAARCIPARPQRVFGCAP